MCLVKAEIAKSERRRVDWRAYTPERYAGALGGHSDVETWALAGMEDEARKAKGLPADRLVAVNKVTIAELWDEVKYEMLQQRPLFDIVK